MAPRNRLGFHLCRMSALATQSWRLALAEAFGVANSRCRVRARSSAWSAQVDL